MKTYNENRKESDKYIDQCMSLLEAMTGRSFKIGTVQEDCEKMTDATDEQGLSYGIRIRFGVPQYWESLTIRTSGSPSELDKLMNGCSDRYLICNYETVGTATVLVSWRLYDCDKLREMILERKLLDKMEQLERVNEKERYRFLPVDFITQECIIAELPYIRIP